MHLTSVHATGFRGSFHYYGAENEWLDFHTYTAGHDIEAVGYTWLGARQGYAAKPTRPVLSLEANFEDLFHQFWMHHEDTTGARRIKAEHVREAMYQGVLSGSLGGVTYGANGIWQWSTPRLMSGFGARVTTLDALDFPGSDQMTVLKDLMQHYAWYSLRPRQDLLVDVETETNVPVAGSFSHVLAYFSKRTSSATLDLRALNENAVYYWVNPTNGERSPTFDIQGDGVLFLQAPDDDDWLFVAENGHALAQASDPQAPFLALQVHNAPNPFIERTTLYLILPEPGVAVISVFDALGRRVDQQEVIGNFSTAEAMLRVPAAGLYVYQVDFAATSGKNYVTTGKMVSLGS